MSRTALRHCPPPSAAAAALPLRRGFGSVAGLAGGAITAATARRLRSIGDGIASQHAAFRAVVGGLSATAFAREHGLERGTAYADFASRTPPRTYEDFAPYVQLMRQGQPDVLCPGRCSHFAVSSGTTEGPSKWLPVNAPMLAHFRRAGLDAIAMYALRSGRRSVFRGRSLFLGGSTALSPVPDVVPPVWSGDLSGITATQLPRWVDRFLYEPGCEIAQMTDWPAKLRAIARRTLAADITLVAGIPTWLLILAETMRKEAAELHGATPATLRELWPHLECLVHGGVPVGPFAAQLRAAYGADVALHEVYPASEAFIAAQDAEPEAGLRLLAGHGVFFEFLPLADYDVQDSTRAMKSITPLEGVRTDVDYVLLLTTPAGLVRYVIGDIVRFTSTRPPRLVYAGRTRLQLSAFGEHVIEKELTDALAAAASTHAFSVAEFHVAPLFPDPAAGRQRARHEWLIELRAASAPPRCDAGTLARDLDAELSARNDDYAAKRQGNGLDLPAVRLLPAGSFERWLRSNGKWGGQSKTPRCRSDRRLADDLIAAAASLG